MKNLKQPSGAYLLEPGVEKLHQESKAWLSEIELWKIELRFFQRLLDRYARSFRDIQSKKKIDQFQNFLIYYSGELLDETHKQVRQHEKSLARQLSSDSIRLDEQDYRSLHRSTDEKVSGIRNQMAEKKGSFFEFIEKVL